MVMLGGKYEAFVIFIAMSFNPLNRGMVMLGDRRAYPGSSDRYRFNPLNRGMVMLG